MTTSLKNLNANARKKMWMPSLALRRVPVRQPAGRQNQPPEAQRKVLKP